MDVPSARSSTAFLLFALIVAPPPRTAGLRSDTSGDLSLPAAAAMVPAVAHMVTMRMDKGQTMSVGFEFECANRQFTLNHTGRCPTINFRLDGVHEWEAWMPLKDTERLSMANWPKMPSCVKNVVWSYDTLSRQAVDGRCNYHLEFKTRPLQNEAQLKEAMVGAAIALRESSKRNGPDGWNTALLFDMKKHSDRCLGSTHVTKAFVVNKQSLLDMLAQQMYIFCVKGNSKQRAGSDHVFRTSFVQAYMVWRAKQHCKQEEEKRMAEESQQKLTHIQLMLKQRNEMIHGTPFQQCNRALSLRSMCLRYWDTPEDGEADVRTHLFDGGTSPILAEVEKNHGKCTPGNALVLMCAELTQRDDFDFEDGDGFGNKTAGCYYGPGGVKGKDTATHLGTALSWDYNTLYAFVEHRKNPWNTQNFRTCLYADLFGKNTERNQERNPQVSCTAVSHILNQSRTCRQALGKVMEVEYAEYSDDMD